MYIKKDYDFNDLKNNSWGGAVATIKRVEKANKGEALMEFLEGVFFDFIPDVRQINTFLRFESAYICESLGINMDDEGI